MKYQKEYEEFMKAYTASGVVDPEAVGALIARLAQYFMEANLAYAKADIAYNIKAAAIEDTVDESTGKKPTSAKAKTLVDATPEGAARIEARAHVVNIDTSLNSLKALQKGLLNEFSHMGNT